DFCIRASLETHRFLFCRLRVESKTKDSVTLSWSSGQYQVRVWHFPFRLEVLCDQEVIVTFNSKDKLWFESLQNKPSYLSTLFLFFPGPSSLGADFCLHGFQHVYGLPQHADRLRLRDTSDGEPYRLYNLDVFAADLYCRLGLYGSVPLIVAHKPDRTVGVFWLNASDTFINIQYSPSDLQGGETPPVKKRRLRRQTDVHWLSESGVIDCMILLGPAPRQLFKQYAQLTGYQAMPPLFSLGYHQCRWNYNDEADVKAVDAGFDRHKIPYDVIWLDIEHTDGKRYFTWDPALFPKPVALQQHLEKKKRKMVVISDPHIKVDPDWPLYREARDGGHFVKDREGQIFQGTCWPGESSYLDFSCPETRGSTPSLFVWNDMNEPSVFNGPEQTMPKDAVHHGGWEHRELHNLYGFYQHMATADGLTSRSGGTERPFVLTRSFFAGSQRLGAIWTGDNVATWEYLKISLPMVLTLNLTGIAFCGADVGGFVKDPDPELLVRWYQAGALLPFFRGHSANDTKRREPWLFGEEVTAAIRTAIQFIIRANLHKNVKHSLSCRPLWVEFPEEESAFTEDNQYMIGGALLACPVTEQGAQTVKVLLPGSDEVKAFITVTVYEYGTLKISFCHRFGTTSALQRRTKEERASADGELYLDDGHSFEYRDKKAFSLRRFSMASGRLLCRSASEEGRFDCDTVVQSVSIMGVKSKPTTVNVHVPGEDVHEMSTFNSYRKKFECFKGRFVSFTAHRIIIHDETEQITM
uniref:Uncharacterized protein n=1 Tax=Poecilia mexicana TaxID=48701 RepID=A0A3B3YUD4_9TELE